MITVKNLSKKYGTTEALKGISFSIKKGGIYCLLGPNGAGKTTIINILSTLTNQDAGEVTINGFDLIKDPQKIKNSIGVAPQEITLDKELSAYENLIARGSLYLTPTLSQGRGSKAAMEEKTIETLKLLGLFESRDIKIKNYSEGMNRRLNLAAALLHSPKIIFLDETTDCIDSESKNLIYGTIEKLSKEGITILCTTQYTEEAERLCNRIGIIDSGKLIAQGTLDELRSLPNTKQCINIQVTNFKDERTANEGLLSKFISEELTDAPGGDFRFRNGILQYFTTDPETDLQRLTDRLSKFGFVTAKVDIQRPNLESIFLSLTGKELRD